MLVKILEPVPESLFRSLQSEINSIDWKTIQDPERSSHPRFKTSKSISLRKHTVPTEGIVPDSPHEWSRVVDCVDVDHNIQQYPVTYELAQWIYKQVDGVSMGKILIVNLIGGGSVSVHQDLREYFEVHSRYHVPVITDERVVFVTGPLDKGEHMPLGYLSRLNNRSIHGVRNRTPHNRVHIIVDVETAEKNTIF